jgi:hypothetical protein
MIITPDGELSGVFIFCAVSVLDKCVRTISRQSLKIDISLNAKAPIPPLVTAFCVRLPRIGCGAVETAYNIERGHCGKNRIDLKT